MPESPLPRLIEPLIANEDSVEQTREQVDKESGNGAYKTLLINARNGANRGGCSLLINSLKE